MSNIKLAFRSYVFGVLDIVLCLEENARNVLTWLCLNQRERERELIPYSLFLEIKVVL